MSDSGNDRAADATVLGDVVARDRRSEAVAVRTDSRAGSYSYRKFCTQSWKAGNLLRHYGVRSGAAVAVDAGDRLSPPPLMALFGAVLLGAAVRFDPAGLDDRGVRDGRDDGGDADTVRALVVPAERTGAYDPPPGTAVLAYGGEPDDPGVAAFEREVWSENPAEPPDDVAPGADALGADGERFSHERLLGAARRVVADARIDDGTVVAPRAPLADPGTVVAGVLAPLLTGGTVLVDRSATGDVGVGRDVPEPRRVDPTSVL